MISDLLLNAFYIAVGVVAITIALLLIDIFTDITEEDHESYDDYKH